MSSLGVLPLELKMITVLRVGGRYRQPARPLAMKTCDVGGYNSTKLVIGRVTLVMLLNRVRVGLSA